MPDFPQPTTGVLVEGGNWRNITAAATLAAGDVALCNSTAAAFTVTLPPVASGGPCIIKKTDAVPANPVTVKTADGSTIDGVVGTTGVALTVQNSRYSLASDGANWWVTAG